MVCLGRERKRLRLILIRHGQSIANVKGIWQGQLEFPLSTQGLQEAKRIGEWLAEEEIDLIYSSDLGRAKHTAEEIARHHQLEVLTTKLLREMNLGRFQGLTRAQIKEKYPELVDIDWLRSDLDDVEQIDQLMDRGLSLIEEWVKNHYGKKVVAVSHGGFIGTLLMALLKIEWKGKRVFTVQNTGMTTIDFSDPRQYVVLGVNETPHLVLDKKGKKSSKVS